MSSVIILSNSALSGGRIILEVFLEDEHLELDCLSTSCSTFHQEMSLSCQNNLLILLENKFFRQLALWKLNQKLHQIKKTGLQSIASDVRMMFKQDCARF